MSQLREWGAPGDPRAPDVGQAEHAPHKMSTTMERHWLGHLASPLTILTSSLSKGAPRSPSTWLLAKHLHGSLWSYPLAPYGLPHTAAASALTPLHLPPAFLPTAERCLPSPAPRIPSPTSSAWPGSGSQASADPPGQQQIPHSLPPSFHHPQTSRKAKGMAALPPSGHRLFSVTVLHVGCLSFPAVH